MIYENTVRGQFISRPNRFIAYVSVNGAIETVHVKNTGKLGELLLPQADVILQKCDDEKRKTKYDLISVYKPGLGWVNIDSQVPNKLVFEWLLKQNYDVVKPEYKIGSSRIDFYMERAGERFLLEVKGCTLEENGCGLFPDAVSSRAAKHEYELAASVGQGFNAAVGFVIAMNGITSVQANAQKDPAFAKAFDYAKSMGVKLLCFSCRVTENGIEIVNCEQN